VREALVGTLPSDDRFLHGAIFVGRVQRVMAGKQPVWAARPEETDKLIDIVLSLFAADILMHRESYETDLCVCNRCGKISFHPRIAGRYGCSEHRSRSRRSGGRICHGHLHNLHAGECELEGCRFA
jgi:hypothetical protein